MLWAVLASQAHFCNQLNPLACIWIQEIVLMTLSVGQIYTKMSVSEHSENIMDTAENAAKYN